MATVTLVALIAMGILANRGTSHAQSDEVCGNDTVDPGEQCDDGNLTSGDGCSAYCLNEVCGNAVTDIGEQCDDGNQVGGDGCGSLCTIEFCGDQVTQSPETCDDGNNVSGDGCSSICQTEGPSTLKGELIPDETASSDAASDTQTVSSDAATAPAVHPAAPVIPQRILQIAVDAATANTFIRSAEGDDYVSYFESADQEALKDILRALRDRKPLTPEQRERAEKFAGDLGLSKFAERDRYNDMLARLIATTISEGVISEQALDQAKLTGDPAAITAELRTVTTPLSASALQNETLALFSGLQRQGVSIDGLSTDQIVGMVAEDRRPVELFEAIVEVKEKVEQAAVPDVEASYQDVLDNAHNLRTMLPVLETEYGIDRAKVEARIANLETTVANATPKDAGDVVDAINKLTVSIQRDRKIDSKALENIDEQAAATYLQRFASVTQEANPLTAGLLSGNDSSSAPVSPGDMLRTVEIAAREAPLMQREAFAGSDVEAQKKSLVQYVYNQPDIMRMRSLLQEDGDGNRAELDRREMDLRESIDRVGEIDVPGDSCDDSMLAADACVEAYTHWLEGAVRNRNVISRVGGFMEDLGVVDWFHGLFAPVGTPSNNVPSASSSTSATWYPPSAVSSASSAPSVIWYPISSVSSSFIGHPAAPSSASSSSAPVIWYPDNASSASAVWYPFASSFSTVSSHASLSSSVASSRRN
ncbi:MAG TPA: DUF4215 domain-containing protein [Candidatus Peribacteria bacterium]|nr:DUF4215 domain-containing protein [Candidatus Peribacteria bacterium]